MYQNGENFHAGCKHQCTCIDGAVGCVPLCPTDIPLASPSCPTPRLVKIPGQCCLSVDCHGKSSVLPPVFRRPQPPPYLFPDRHTYKKPRPKPYPYKPKDSLSNELIEVEKKWDKPRSRKHLPGEGMFCVSPQSFVTKTRLELSMSVTRTCMPNASNQLQSSIKQCGLTCKCMLI